MVRKTRERFLNAINESYSALLSVADATEMRGHKVSRTVIAEARKGEREVADLTRKWLDEPGSFFDNMEAVISAQTAAQRRALELARESLGGAEEYRHEVQVALAKVIEANRDASQAMTAVMRQASRAAATRVRGAATAVRTARPLRRRAPAPAPGTARTKRAPSARGTRARRRPPVAAE